MDRRGSVAACRSGRGRDPGRAAARREILTQLAEGALDILIGTHALIQEDVVFKDLSFVVIDEQHRFGVRQRGLLTDKAHGYQPHLLSMTATPIPRTLNLVLHGDLDVSIAELREAYESGLPHALEGVTANV